MNKRRSAFTLVEILVVLAIIAILAAILFPAFNRAKEAANQTNCASNLQQIYTAVQLYRQDENRYPATLVDLLGEGARYDDGSATGGTLGTNAPGYFKGGKDSLVCRDDDSLSNTARSSYGSLSKKAATTPLPTNPNQISATNFTGDLSQYVWNYWGTRDDGFTFGSPSDAATAMAIKGNSIFLVNPALPYNTRINGTAPYPNNPENVVKYSMSYRFAPTATIITHCIYHRLPTANNINNPGELYGPAPVDGANVKDIVLRLDGAAKAVDVSQWNPTTSTTDPTTNIWETQTK